MTLYDKKGQSLISLEMKDESTFGPLESPPRLVLRDDKGMERAALGIADLRDGKPRTYLTMSDDGFQRAAILIEREEAEFRLYHPYTKKLAAQDAANVEAAQARTKSRNDGIEEAVVAANPTAVSIIARDGTTSLTLTDEDNTDRAKITMGKDGTAQVLTADKKGNLRPVK